MSEETTGTADVTPLVEFLSECPPLGALDVDDLRQAAARGRVRRFARGELVLDAFTKRVRHVAVVLEGEIHLWNDPESVDPDEIVGPRGIFGYSAMLAGRAIGPRAVAGTQATVLQVPDVTVERAFTTPAGALFLVERLAIAARTSGRRPTYTMLADRDLHPPAPPDVLGSRAAPGIALHGHIRRSASGDDLREQMGQVPAVLADLLESGVVPSRVIAVNASLLDAVVHRSIELVLDRHRSWASDRFTWLALGSHGRRESVPSSDVDAAVVFDDTVAPTERTCYRKVFTEVDLMLACVGLQHDTHGVTPTRSSFARTRSGWQKAARGWLATPSEDQGAIMASLLIDGRTVHGRADGAAREIFGGLRADQGGMRSLLLEALSTRARPRSVLDLLRRSDRFDVKRHALLPIVNLARWVAFSVGSPALSTVDRLRAAAGTEILPELHARTLSEVVEVLQGIRLRYQLRQIAKGEAPSDVLELDRLSPIDRSIIARAVREIAAAQRRADNLVAYIDPEQWMRPAAQGPA